MVLFVIGCIWILSISGVVGILTTNHESSNGVLTVCPGDFISITCTHNNTLSGVTRWEVRGSSASCDKTIVHGTPDTTCGLFVITMISGTSGPTFNSTAQITATEGLNGSVVECFDTGLSSLVGNINIKVLTLRVALTVKQVDPLIEWVQMDNPLYPTCITGYLVVDQLTGQNTTVSSTTRSLTAQQLNEAGFPYCITIHPTVTPITSMGLFMTAQGTTSLHTIVRDPNFPIPRLIPSFTFGKKIILHITTQNVSESMVPTRNYQYTFNGTTSPLMGFNSDNFVIELPGVEHDQAFLITVQVTFQRDSCMETVLTNFTATAVIPPTIGEPPSSGGCGVACIAGIVVAAVVVMLLLTIIVVVLIIKNIKASSHSYYPEHVEKLNNSKGTDHEQEEYQENL